MSTGVVERDQGTGWPPPDRGVRRWSLWLALGLLMLTGVAALTHYQARGTGAPGTGSPVDPDPLITSVSRLGSPVSGDAASAPRTYWDCPDHTCVRAVASYELPNGTTVRQVIADLNVWAGAHRLVGTADTMQCDALGPARSTSEGDCAVSFQLPNQGGEVFVFIRMANADEIPQPHYDAEGWVGAGSWTDWADVKVSTVFLRMGLNSNED